MIEVKSVSKSYGKINAVSGVSFSIDAGDIVGFIGRNGAGKSTTMGIMTGCIFPDNGSVIIDGYDISQNPLQAKSLLGFLPEQPPLYNEFTVYEYLSVIFDMKNIKANKKTTINDAVEKSGLSEMTNRRVGNLSKGYRQRVGLAQAILGNPKYIILDEPTEGMDPEQKKDMLRLIKKLGKEKGIILSSHILSEIDMICNRILMLDDGRLITDDNDDDKNSLKKYVYIIDSDSKTVIRVLEKIKGIQDIQIIREGKRDTELIVSVMNAKVCDEIFYTLANAQLPIKGMSEYTVKSERFFRKSSMEKKYEGDI